MMSKKVHDFQFLSLLQENKYQGNLLTHPTVLLLLNSPQLSFPWIQRLWSKCDLIICADGAANRLYEMTSAKECYKDYIPHYIKGDLDSLDPEIWKYYESLGTQVIQDLDQDSNDMEKCLQLASDVMKERHVTANVVLLGVFGGRIDQQFACFHSIKLFQSQFHDMIMLDDDNLGVCLCPNTHQLIHPRLNPNSNNLGVGILPVFGPVRQISSKGLKWELSNHRLEYGILISSSNQAIIDSNDECNHFIVEVECNDTVLWTCDLTSIL